MSRRAISKPRHRHDTPAARALGELSRWRQGKGDVARDATYVNLIHSSYILTDGAADAGGAERVCEERCATHALNLSLSRGHTGNK